MIDMAPTAARPLARILHEAFVACERVPGQAELDAIQTFADLCRYEDTLVAVAQGAEAIGRAGLTHGQQDQLFTFGPKVAMRLLVGYTARKPYLASPRFYDMAYQHLWGLANRCHPGCGCD